MFNKLPPPSCDRSIRIDDPIVQRVWEKDCNYLIDYSIRNHSKICTIYFSSNGIYYPNTENTFNEIVIKKNRYEWYDTRVKDAQKHIFVRDVFKQWYVKGINSQIDTQAKLLDFLRKETEGYDIITIGSSAGGYASALFGTLLHAKIALAFSPQITLESMISDDKESKNPILRVFFLNGKNGNKMTILDTIKRNQHLFMFYSILSKNDQLDIELADKAEINVVKFNGDVHGIPFKSFALPKVINMHIEELRLLTKSIHNPLLFSLRFCQWKIFIRRCHKAFFEYR